MVPVEAKGQCTPQVTINNMSLIKMYSQILNHWQFTWKLSQMLKKIESTILECHIKKFYRFYTYITSLHYITLHSSLWFSIFICSTFILDKWYFLKTVGCVSCYCSARIKPQLTFGEIGVISREYFWGKKIRI